MSVNEMKNYLSSYQKLMQRSKKLIREIEIFPQDKSFLEPLLCQVTSTAEDISLKISAVKNPDYRELLFRKYINGETLEQIGESMCYSARHVQRMLNNAVASMSEVNVFDRQ